MTDLEICNRALAHLGDFKITDLTQPTLDADSRAEVVNRFLPIAKREVLSTMDWQFAITDDELTEGTAPTVTYKYAHNYPANCWRVVAVHTATETNPGIEGWTKLETGFQLRLSTVRTNHEFVAIEYVTDADFSVWPSTAQAACARLLASYAAVSITGNDRKAEYHLSLYRKLDLPTAQHEHATEYASNENFNSSEDITRSDLFKQHVSGLTSLETQ